MPYIDESTKKQLINLAGVYFDQSLDTKAEVKRKITAAYNMLFLTLRIDL